MNITSVLKLATAFVALSISAHAVEIFSVSTVSTTYPVTSAGNFNAVDEEGNFTNQYNIYGTTDTGTGSGTGWGSGVTSNFNGATPWTTETTDATTGEVTINNFTSVVNPGDQFAQGSNLTTYFGPKFYAGLNRDAYKGSAGVIHSNGNGYRIRVNDIAQDDIDGNDGNGINFKAVFLFDADTSSLAEGDGFIFSPLDTLDARISVPNNLGTEGRASLATYRPMVKAGGEYYAGPLYTVDLSVLTGSNSTNIDISDSGADATWTLLPNMERTNNSLQGAASHPKNLTVISDGTETTLAGSDLTNITQVGFLLETTGEVNSGGYNYGVKQFSANATAASAPPPLDPIEWSEDFTDPVTILDGLGGLSGDTHAYTWSKSGNGLTADPASSVTQGVGNVILEVNSQGSGGAARLHMVGSGTDNARRVAPVFHETTFVLDLINFKNAQSDLTLRTRGHDGYVQSVISPSGIIKYSSWMSNYVHTSFDNFSGPSSLRNNTNNPGIVIVEGGTFVPDGTDVEITISGDAEGAVVMNADSTAVVSVSLSNYGSGYIADPTVTFSGGGMTVAPTVSFNYETGNITNQNVVQVDLGTILPLENGNKNWNVLADGQTLTYIQSYNPIDESISYYFSLDGSDPIFITTLTTADSAGGHGFYDFTTGNKWVQPRNQDAIYIQYQRWGTGGITGRVGINSVSVATSDDDGDGVNNRNDLFPDDENESVDADGDGVGDNGDAHPGYNDTTFTPYLDSWLAENNYVIDDGTSTGGLTEEDLIDLRAGPTTIDVSGGSANIAIRMEESSDLATTWSDLGSLTMPAITLDESDGAKFFRVKLAED